MGRLPGSVVTREAVARCVRTKSSERSFFFAPWVKRKGENSLLFSRVEAMRLDAKGGFPIALVVSILAHAFIIRTVHVRVPEALPRGEVVEVMIGYAAPAPVDSPLAPPLKTQPFDLRAAPQEPAPRVVEREIPLAPAEQPPSVPKTAADPPGHVVREDAPSAEKAGASETGEDKPPSIPGGVFYAEKSVAPNDSDGAQAQEPADAHRQSVEWSLGEQPRSGRRTAPLEQSAAARINEELSRRIDRRKVYPPAARKRRIEGSVVCELEVDPAGNLGGVRVIGSSGSAILDDAAVALLKGVFPIKNPVGGPLILVKTIRYSLVD
jgi:protein TonB